MKIVITVPGHLTYNAAVEPALHDLMKLAGGVTVCPAQGQWVDPDGRTIIEPVEQYHFAFPGPAVGRDAASIDHTVRKVCKALIASGEQAVMVERYDQRYIVNLYTAKDFP